MCDFGIAQQSLIRDAAHIRADTAQQCFFTKTFFNPSCAALIAAIYPPDPAPITTTSYCSAVFSPFHNLDDFDHGLADGMTAFDDLMRLIDLIQPEDIFNKHFDLSGIDQAGSFR